MASLMPLGKQQYFSNAGVPLVAGKLYTYAAGTLTPLATFSDQAGTVPNTNPIILDTRGEASIFWGSTGYKAVLQDATGATIWTQDNLFPQASTSVQYTDLTAATGSSVINFIAAGTGAVTRPAQSKLRDSVSASDYSSVQFAIDAAVASGLSTVLLTKIYTLTSTLTLPSNFSLIGAGPLTGLAYDDGVVGITIVGTVGVRKTGVILQNFSMTKTGGTTGQHLVMTLCDDSVVSNITYNGALGVNPCYSTFNGTRGVRSANCNYFGGSSEIWNSDTGLTSGVWGEGNSSSFSVLRNPKQGVTIAYQKSFNATALTASGASSTYGCGFLVEFETIGVTLTNCVSYGHVRAGFYIEGNVAYGCKDTQLISCISYGNGESGIDANANFINLTVIGGEYRNNLSTFAAGTGHGIFCSGSEQVRITSGVVIRNNAGDGIKYVANPYRLTISNCDIANNTGFGINLLGTLIAARLEGNNIIGNTAGIVNGWTYVGNNEWDMGPWQTFAPIFYKSNEITTVTFASSLFEYRRWNNQVEFRFACLTPTPALDTNLFVSIPIAGDWPDNSVGISARLARGVSSGDVSGGGTIDGVYASDKLRVSKTGATDTIIVGAGSYSSI